MVYVMLDTNIIIDMLVDRRKHINAKLVKSFIQLLDKDEICLLVPEIVKTETYRNIGSEFDKVGNNLKSTIDSIDNLYGVILINDESFDLEKYKDSAKKEIAEFENIFEKNKDKYKKAIYDVIELLFSHKNTRILQDKDLMGQVLKRKIYKRAPFHKVEKESNGDGVITETLINICKFVDLKEEDKIFFVTGNYKDFAESKDRKDVFHIDIVEDLKTNGLDEKIELVNQFGILVSKKLKDQKIHAEELEKIEKEFMQEELEAQAEYEEEISDLERESFGLSPLSSFESEVDEILSTSDFASTIQEQSSEFFSIKNDLEEIEGDIEILLYDLRNLKLGEKSIYSKLEEAADILDCLSNKTCGEVIDIYENLNNMQQEISRKRILLEKIDFESLEFGSQYEIYDADERKYTLCIGEKYLCPASGEKDEIELSLISDDFEVRKHGSIEVCYGYMNTDEDGGILNGEEESISVDSRYITSEIDQIIKRWKDYTTEVRDKTEALQNLFSQFGC